MVSTRSGCFYVTLLIGCVIQITSGVTKCSHNEQKCVRKSAETSKKYSEAWNRYFAKIGDAIANWEHLHYNQSDCSVYSSTMDLDLYRFRKNGINKEMFDKSVDKGVRYQIIDGVLHRVMEGKKCVFDMRCQGNEVMLKQVAADVPNTEFVVNEFDYPVTYSSGSLHPVFSFSRQSSLHADIMYPTWSFIQGGPAIHPLYSNGIGDWEGTRLAIHQTAKRYTWRDKRPIGFFRGSRTSDSRDNLILLSLDKPDLLDARYTKNQAFKSAAKDLLGLEAADYVSFEDHCQYQYLFNFPGVAASFRFRHILLCQSLVFHIEGNDPWLEFFYSALKPWFHYIPVSDEMKEIEDLLEFFTANPELAEQIGRRGSDFIMQHLRMSEVFCYWRRLLRRYARLLTYNVTKHSKAVVV